MDIRAIVTDGESDQVALTAKPEERSVTLRGVDSNSGPLRVVTAVCLVAVCLMAAFIGILAINRIVGGNGNRDFVEYWAAGKLVVHGGNPYDVPSTLRLERSAGANFIWPLITPSPPIILPLLAPLGLVSERAASILEGSILIICLLVSIRIIWVLNGRPSGRLHLFSLCLAPVLTCLMAGQIGIILLLGIALFLRYHLSHPFFAGVALLPCALKPHLFLPVAIILVLWAVTRKTYSIFAGITVALIAAGALSFVLDSNAWQQYLQLVAIAKPTEPFVPTLSKLFRLLVHRDSVWLQFVPSALSCGWALWYFFTRRDRWNWINHGLLLLLVSVAFAPYSWYTDEAILLPAILVGIYRTQQAGRSLLPFALIAAAPLAELLCGLWITTPYYVWNAPAWIVWYLYETRGSNYAFQSDSGTGLSPLNAS